jgi:DNA polymerase-3 subunit alpha
MKNYTPLHCHSHYSLLDGLSKPDQIAKRINEIGASACALTDHGNISGAVQFYSCMKKNKIKPILGCEIYMCHDDPKKKTKENYDLSHFLVLAKNLKGWKKLIHLVSRSNDPECFYRKPRIDIKGLQEYAGDDLIGICGHLGSYITDKISVNNQIIDNWKTVGSNTVDELKSIFGKENFFLEAQLMDYINNPIQIEITEKLRSLAQITNTKILCTPDAHYCRKEDAVDQRILLCNNLKTTFPEIQRKSNAGIDIGMNCFFESDNFHILSQEEINDLHTEEEIENTNLVESMCEDYDILHKPMLPPFDCPKGFTDAEYLRQLCRDGWKSKIEKDVPKDKHGEYVDRIKYELDVLQGADLSSYFLIVQDIVNHIRDNNWLPGPGRGSAAGCLVSYLIGITSIDPIKYNLIFDRFYNAGRNTKDRISMPDIDVDVPINKREVIIQYIKDKYGSDKVSQMITYNTMKGRGALKDVLRVYGNITFEEMNKITKNIPDEAKIADELQEMKEEYGEASIIRWALENNPDELREWCSINKDTNEIQGPLAKRFEQAIRLEGTKSNQSKHAAGVVISQHKLEDTCPMVYDSKNKQLIAGMEMQDLESLGVIKFDILGIAMLDKIMSIQDLLKSNSFNLSN